MQITKIQKIQQEIANRELDSLYVELARREFLAFVEYTKKDYKANWHHQVLCDYIQAFVDGDIKKLMVWMPPQYGKSELTSRRLPSYLLGINPDLRIAICSYAADLASSFNRDVKRIIQSEEYSAIFPDTTLSSKNVKNSAKGEYLNNADIFEIVGRNGSLKSVGVGGPLSGFPVDVLLIDDPVKDEVEGNSLTDQERKWGWYMKVARARLHKDSKQLITMTRWSKGDLSGRILEAFPNSFEILKLEAIKKTKVFINPSITPHIDPREYGGVLWPQRHSKKDVIDTANADPSTFDALYQQNPKPNQSRVYATGFNYGRIVKGISLKKYLPLHYTVDFNTSPYMTGLVVQMEYVDDDVWNGYSEFWEVTVIDKFALKSPINDAQSLGREMELKYPTIKNGFFLYGDASGNSNTGISSPTGVIKTKTLFSDLISGLSEITKNNVTRRIPKSNPKYRSIGQGMLGRRVFLNKVLSGSLPVRILISPTCSELIEDFEECTADANGKLAKPKTRGGVEMHGHMLQAFEYFICNPNSIGYLARK